MEERDVKWEKYRYTQRKKEGNIGSPRAEGDEFENGRERAEKTKDKERKWKKRKNKEITRDKKDKKRKHIERGYKTLGVVAEQHTKPFETSVS